jgi:hypothetical protein
MRPFQIIIIIIIIIINATFRYDAYDPNSSTKRHAISETSNMNSVLTKQIVQEDSSDE